MTATTIRTWWLDPQQVTATLARIGRINARAARHGLDGRYAGHVTGRTRTEPVFDDRGARGCEWREWDGQLVQVPMRLENGFPVPCPLIGQRVAAELIIAGEPPRFGGWQLLAVLTWDEDVFIARTAAGFDEKVSESDVRRGWCDHCRSGRRRNDTYLVGNAGTGERRQVGSSCIRDFLGHPVAAAAIDLFGDELDEIERSARACGWDSAPARDVLERAAALVRQQGGWFSRDRAHETGRPATADLLRAALFPVTSGDHAVSRTSVPDDDDKAEAAKAAAWIAAQDAGTAYLDSVQRLAAADWVSSRNVALLGSALAAYHRALAREAEQQARARSRWFGSPGRREEFTLTVAGITWLPDTYSYHGGSKPLYLLRDPHGNIAKWFASRDQGWRDGDTIRVRATVKAHGEWHGVRETQLTRCSLVAS
jgi:hypothetical protein